jgi:universal stress protein A
MPPTITRILVPTDFSSQADLALDYAKSFAERYGASLHLLHVLEDPFMAGAWSSEIYVADMPQVRATLVAEAEKRLARMLSGLDRARFNVTTEVRLGTAAQSIRDVADETGVNLIVMGTHGRSGMAHLLLGSVAEKLVRIAPCPVLTVRSGARGAEAFEGATVASAYMPSA